MRKLLLIVSILLFFTGCATFDGLKNDYVKMTKTLESKPEKIKKPTKQVVYEKEDVEFKCFNNQAYFDDLLKAEFNSYKNKYNNNYSLYEETYKILKEKNRKLTKRCLKDIRSFKDSFKYLEIQLNGGKR